MKLSTLLILLSAIGFIVMSMSEGTTTAQRHVDTPLEKCEYGIKMSDLTYQTAAKLYEKGEYDKARQKLILARANLIENFQDCQKTPLAGEAVKKSAHLSELIGNKDLNIKANIQKLIKGAK